MNIAQELAKMIDHSLLKPDMTRQDVIDGCMVAKQYGTASVCVKPSDVALAREMLAGSGVLVGTVIGFPHGAHKTEVKVFEAETAMDEGAVELDMVINIGHFKSEMYDEVEEDIAAVVEVAHERGAIVKVILENAYLTKDEIVLACKICESAGADYVKTSTGYAPGGATPEDCALMKASVSAKVKVKAAGGVRTYQQAMAVREAGVSRFGATATAAIIKEATEHII